MSRSAYLFINLDHPSRVHSYHLEYYTLLEKYSKYIPYLYGYESSFGSLKSYRFYYGPIKELKNSLILLFGFNNHFLELDPTNQIICFVDQPLTSRNLSILAKANLLVVASFRMGYQLSLISQSVGINIPIIRLLPWIDIESYDEIILPAQDKLLGSWNEIDPDYHRGLSKIKILKSKSELSSLWALICLSQKDLMQDVILAMLLGVPVICIDQPPFNELIIHKYNGLLIRTESDLIAALKYIDSSRFHLVSQSHQLIRQILNHEDYMKLFVQATDYNFYNLNTLLLKPKRDKWIVRDKNFDSGKISYYPENFDRSFSVADVYDFMDIIEFFSNRIFLEVYVFGCEFNDYSSAEMLQIERIISRMNQRARKIFFCLNSIPSRFKRLFEKLALIPLSEGLKQIK